VRPYLWYAVIGGTILAAPAAGFFIVAETRTGVDGSGQGRSPSVSTAPRGPAVAALTPALAAAVARDRAPGALNGNRGPNAFYFTRGIYSEYRRGGRRGWNPSWATDYPKADQQFLTVLLRLTNLDASDSENAVALDDPELRRFPFLYILEVGNMSLTPAEVEGLRGYLLAGGFVFVDDFWGTAEWRNFEQEMQRVLPEYGIVDLPLDHPLFSSFYEITEIIQVPSVGNVRSYGESRTWERDGYVPHVRAIFDDDGRLMMMINWNTDLGDAWEWAEQPYYPLKFSTFAYQMGVNAIVYAMSH
jgi:hypothetical protein